MRVPVQQYLANSAHFGLTEPWLSIPAAQLACLLVLRPCALAALHITAPFVPLTLDLVQFEDVQHLTQLKWDLQVGKDYYTGENGPEEKRAIDVCRCIAEIQRQPQLSDISLLQCAQHTRRKPSWPHTVPWNLPRSKLRRTHPLLRLGAHPVVFDIQLPAQTSCFYACAISFHDASCPVCGSLLCHQQ